MQLPAGSEEPPAPPEEPVQAESRLSQPEWEPDDDSWSQEDGSGVDLDVLPAVVAVVVVHDDPDGLRRTLDSLAEQDYPGVEVLVLDAASAEDPTALIAERMPTAFVRRLDADQGFGQSANQAVENVEGATFLLFMASGVRLQFHAVQALVEEAFRSNAGILGPKLVEDRDTARLVAVGMSADRLAFASSPVERGELDQEQHDAVRDVFFLPKDCLLVRADLFRSLGGFASDLVGYGDDLDLCWRAQVAGARVVVVPDAIVATPDGPAGYSALRSRIATRSRLRMVFTNYSAPHLLRVLPQAVASAVIDLLAGVVSGRGRKIAATVLAWVWVIRHPGLIWERRRHVRSIRHVPDADVRRGQSRGSARLASYVRHQLSGGSSSAITSAGRGLVDAVRTRVSRATLVAWAGFVLTLLFGSRHLITQGVPDVRELTPITDSPLELLRHHLSGWGSTTLGDPAGAPTALPVLAALWVLFAGQTGLLLTATSVGAVLVGGVGAWRLLRFTGSGGVRAAALIAYGANPLPYDALGEGRWQALLIYASLPWLFAELARSIPGLPFAPDGSRRSTLRSALGTGLLLALVAALAPMVVPVLGLLVVSLWIGSVVSGAMAGTGRLVLVGLGGAVVCGLLHLPWLLGLAGSEDGWAIVTGTRPPGGSDLFDLLGFDLGRTGGGLLTWGLLVAAALPLLIGREWRFDWAVRAWMVALAGWAAAFFAERGQMPVRVPAAEVLMTLPALGLAVAVAMGMAAFQIDLAGYRFGWRQALSAVAFGAILLSVAPVAGATVDGRWGLHDSDLSGLVAQLDTAAPYRFRTVWIGRGDDIPVGSWEIGDDLSIAVTDGAAPSAVDLFPGPLGGGGEALRDSVELALDGSTNRLGRLLAPLAVRYVVVTDGAGPDVDPRPAVASMVDDHLSEQLDVTMVPLSPSVRLYENTAFLPERWTLAEGQSDDQAGGLPAGDGGAAARADLDAAEPALSADGPLSADGDLEGGTSLHHAATAADGWTLEVDGDAAEQVVSFGWADAYEIAEGGSAELTYETPLSRWGLLGAQVLVLLLVLVVRAGLRPDPDEEPLTPIRPPGGGDGDLEADPEGGAGAFGTNRRWRPDSAIHGEEDW